MKFFEGIKTLDELRKEYRRLAFLYHPEKGGDTAIMQVINDQYYRLSKKLLTMDQMRDLFGSQRIEIKSETANQLH